MSMNYEDSVVDVEEAGAMMLQDILAMTEPKRTYYLRAWVEAAENAADGGVVKIATTTRKSAKVPFKNGKEDFLNVAPAGKKVARTAAIRLLQEFGQGGIYQGVDVATGMSRDAWENLQYEQPEVAAKYKNRNFMFNEFTLVQIPFGSDEDEVVEEATSKE